MAGIAETTELKTGRTGVISAPDPLTVSPDTHKLLFENDLIRVIDINLRKGEGVPMHSHPDYLVYALTPCRIEFTSPDDITQVVDIKAGDVQWRETETHSSDNVGDTDCHVLNIEFKQSGRTFY